tara:strand:+ start:7762 stop:8862 length:1101 start_codon:yes stop_codon:yes gene_type:complete
MNNMKYIDENVEVTGKKVLVRAGLNVPLHEERIVDDFRIKNAIDTLKFLHTQGAQTIVIAHIGRRGNESLRHVSELLSEHVPVVFGEEHLEKMKDGDIVLLENLRRDPRETNNDESFARELADLAEIFVQDAFEVCHREHASIVGVAKHLPSYGGLLLKREITALSMAFKPRHPALFILGGGKVITKEPLAQKFEGIYDAVFIGGILQNEILSARGLEIGKSAVEDGAVPFSVLSSPKVVEVEDVIIEDEKGGTANISIHDVAPTDTIVDMGEATTRALIDTLHMYKTIVWNGPLGWYERGYDASTVTLLHAVAKSNAKTIVGGGDTVAVIQKEGLEDDLSFVSTGGGAMLQFLQEGTLPGIEALG